LSTSFSNSPVLAFEPRWSVPRLIATVLQYFICVTIPWLLTALAIETKALLSIVAVGSLSVALIRVGWWGRRRVSRITWQQSGEWILTRPSLPVATPWVLQPSSFVTPWLVILRWRRDGESAAVAMLYGEMAHGKWRQWQSRLRLQGGQDPGISGHSQ